MFCITLFCHSWENYQTFLHCICLKSLWNFGKHFVRPHLAPSFGTILHPAIFFLLSEVPWYHFLRPHRVLTFLLTQGVLDLCFCVGCVHTLPVAGFPIIVNGKNKSSISICGHPWWEIFQYVVIIQASHMLKTIATIVTEHAQLSDLSSLYSLSALLSLGVCYER